MKYSLEKFLVLTTKAMLSCSFLLLAACGTQKKAAEVTPEKNRSSATTDSKMKQIQAQSTPIPERTKFNRVN